MAFDADDLAAFLDADMPGYQAATYDGATAINGLFRNAGAIGLGIVAGTDPTFTCRADDIAADPRDKTLLINGTAYTIADYRPDATGEMMVLSLQAP